LSHPLHHLFLFEFEALHEVSYDHGEYSELRHSKLCSSA
jgi:hypothetical protein